MTDDRFDALVPGGAIRIAGADDGPLRGLTFVAKDVFDVLRTPTGAGSPARRAAAQPAPRSAAAVERLLAAGATLVGKARTDELAYGLSGRNELDGSPRNPAAPEYLTGGSSSGSAAAVAGGLADIGLGTDTGGSIRVPASHCGIYGVRPTLGRVPTAGLVPLAPSFDTVAWLCATGALLEAVGAVLLDGFTPAPAPTRLVMLDDVAVASTRQIAADALGLPVRHAALGRLDEWREAFRVLQGAEAWATHGPWLTEAQPDLSAAVRQRFKAAARITTAEVADASRRRKELRTQLLDLLEEDNALVVPAAGPLLLVDADATTVDRSRQATLIVTCLASLAGLPAVALPIPTEGLPLGLSLIGGPGRDESLLRASCDHHNRCAH